MLRKEDLLKKVLQTICDWGRQWELEDAAFSTLICVGLISRASQKEDKEKKIKWWFYLKKKYMRLSKRKSKWQREGHYSRGQGKNR